MTISIKSRPKITTGTTEEMNTECGSLFVTVNFVDGNMFEVFATLGKTGGCAAAQSEAICRIISIMLRADIDIRDITKQLKGIRCPAAFRDDTTENLSCADAISKAMMSAISNNHHDYYNQ